MKQLNFNNLMSLKPFLYKEGINSKSQKVQFFEHPNLGDTEQVIIVFADLNLAYYSNFYELGEIDEIGGEYEIVFCEIENKPKHLFELKNV
jgi:hypothetical protein